MPGGGLPSLIALDLPIHAAVVEGRQFLASGEIGEFSPALLTVPRSLKDLPTLRSMGESHASLDGDPPEREIAFDPSYSQLTS